MFGDGKSHLNQKKIHTSQTTHTHTTKNNTNLPPPPNKTRCLRSHYPRSSARHSSAMKWRTQAIWAKYANVSLHEAHQSRCRKKKPGVRQPCRLRAPATTRDGVASAHGGTAAAAQGLSQGNAKNAPAEAYERGPTTTVARASRSKC